MKNWPKVDQLDDVEKPETLEYIRTKYGAYKIEMKRAKTFIYFKCPKNTCKFQMRLEKRGGALQALHEHNHSMEEISSIEQPFQNDLDVWRKVEQLDDAEQLESQAYIRNKYGLYKSIDKRDPERQKFIYFYCTKSKSKTCRFKLRWDRRSGTLEALGEHNHSVPLEPLPDKLLTNEKKDSTQKEENKKINQPPTVPPIAKNSVPKKKKIQKPTNGVKKPAKGEMPKKEPFLSHEEARRIMMGFKPTKMSKDKRGQE